MMLDSKKPIVSINLTPLVDVSLVLVVIFMATAPMFLQSGFLVTAGEKKTEADQSQASNEEKNILVKLRGETILLDEAVVAEQDLPARLTVLLSHSRSGRVIVNPERSVLHGKVVRIIDLAKKAGAKKMVILGKSSQETAP